MTRKPVRSWMLLFLVPLLLTAPAAAQDEAMDKAKDMAMEKAGEMAEEKVGEMAGEKAGEMAGEMAKEMMGEKPEEAAEGAPEVSPEMAEMMAAWQWAMTPGDAHASLAEDVGTWDMTITAWMDPAAPPMVSQGTAERSMILGGRVLKESVTSSMEGMPFEGLGMTGYDNVTGKYWSTWMDNMSTGCYVMHGAMDEDGVATFTGEFDDPMTKAKKKARSVIRKEGADKQTMEWYEDRGSGEMKTMEIVYLRQTE